MLRREQWHRLAPGIYSPPGAPPTPTLRMTAVQQLVPEAVASHRSAAGLHGLAVLRHRLEITVPVRRRPSVPGLTVHRATLPATDVVRPLGHHATSLHATSLPRTLVDLLRSAEVDEAVASPDSALHQRLITLSGLRSALDTRLTGRPRTRALGVLARTDPAAESPAESVARVRMQEAGLRPESQVRLTCAGGRRIRADFGFRAEGLLIEIEGYAWHGTRADHERDVRRYKTSSTAPASAASSAGTRPPGPHLTAESGAIPRENPPVSRGNAPSPQGSRPCPGG
ncbi:hypothetical protein PJ985_04120 [Streptomyces sp. ACA25]|uniref:hypothetical protein n=1 Tax=Streptomyces sp. ACA25 TaxID=3022596 RepID=UPI002307BB21|nr:hypothetical protein [Streptomyces sp. ACA25]MDB1086752.1 hypothetical protein [Streptomyces sp. ACA25]